MSILDSAAESGHAALDPIAAKIKNPFNNSVSKGGVQGPDFPAGFEIVEYIDGVPQNQTASGDITLSGVAMPMQPFPWGAEQRLTKDYYPGNPEPAVHVMGSKQHDLVIHGRFKDKHYQDENYYGAAYEFARALEEMCKRGNLVRFGMQGEDGSWLRYGFLEKVDFKMNKLSWIDYDLSFFVIGENQPRNNYFASPEKATPTALNENLLNAATDFNGTYSQIPDTMPASIADKMNGLINGVAQNINLVTGFVQTILTTAQSVVSSANRALGLIKNARTTLNGFRKQLDGLKSSFSSLTSSGNAVGQARDTYKNKSYIANARTASFSMSAYLAQMQAHFEQLAKTLPIARHKVAPGDTLQKISIKFYGSQDNWDKIYSHNRLANTVLVPGTVLEIPKV